MNCQIKKERGLTEMCAKCQIQYYEVDYDLEYEDVCRACSLTKEPKETK